MPEKPDIRGQAVVPHETELPPPRPGVRYVQVRMLGIVIADDRLRHRVHRFFHWPMIVLALAVLPLLAIEIFFKPEHGTWLWWLWLCGLVIIWIAFTVEFVIKVAIAESRVEYCRRNWLDIIIILIPVLRPLRVASVAKTTRVFTLRGVGMKFARYVFTILLGLEATDRMLRRFGLKADDGRKPLEKMTRHQLICELKQLRRLTDEWERWWAAHASFLQEQGMLLPGHEPRPEPERFEAIEKAEEDEDGPTMQAHADRTGTTEPDGGRHRRQHPAADRRDDPGTARRRPADGDERAGSPGVPAT